MIRRALIHQLSFMISRQVIVMDGTLLKIDAYVILVVCYFVF
jgi:hypothetical protein